MVPVPLGNDGYPVLVERHAYYFGDNYVPFNGTIEDIKSKYTDPTQAPTFYEKKAVLEVDKYGVYTVEARNRIFNSMSKKKSDSAIFKRPEPIAMDNKNQTTAGHIIGETTAILDPVFNMAPEGDLTYQWKKAVENSVIVSDYKVIDVPANTEISYGENHIRMMVPATTEFSKQNVGAGGNAKKYYVTLVNYIPDGAIYMRNGFRGVLEDEDYEVIAEKTVGYDDYGYYRKVWFNIATYNEATDTWTYDGKNSTK
jgi:hypothetical protein